MLLLLSRSLRTPKTLALDVQRSLATHMLYLLLNWTLGTAGLALLSIVLPGFRIEQTQSALIAVAVVALVHAAVSSVFRPDFGEAVLPGILLAFGDTIVFRLVALLVPGFAMLGFYPAIAGAMLLFGLNLALPRLFHRKTATAEPLLNS